MKIWRQALSIVQLQLLRVFAFIRFSEQAWNAHKCKNLSSSMRGFLCPGLDFLRILRMLRRSKKVVLPNAFHRLRRCRLFHLLAFVNKFTTLANKKASQTSFERPCARDWIRTSTTFRMLRPEHSASTNFATRAGGKCRAIQPKRKIPAKQFSFFYVIW